MCYEIKRLLTAQLNPLLSRGKLGGFKWFHLFHSNQPDQYRHSSCVCSFQRFQSYSFRFFFPLQVGIFQSPRRFDVGWLGNSWVFRGFRGKGSILMQAHNMWEFFFFPIPFWETRPLGRPFWNLRCGSNWWVNTLNLWESLLDLCLIVIEKGIAKLKTYITLHLFVKLSTSPCIERLVSG